MVKMKLEHPFFYTMTYANLHVYNSPIYCCTIINIVRFESGGFHPIYLNTIDPLTHTQTHKHGTIPESKVLIFLRARSFCVRRFCSANRPNKLIKCHEYFTCCCIVFENWFDCDCTHSDDERTHATLLMSFGLMAGKYSRFFLYRCDASKTTQATNSTIFI